MYARGFVAGNDGNISVRIAPDRVLCTPTLVCKGFMKPDDLCVVDLAGNQLSGTRKRTSEILMHLEVYRGTCSPHGFGPTGKPCQGQEVEAVVHCHPPHATAFAVAREDVPSGILPEVEVFLGKVPRAEYETPGSGAFAATIRPFIGKATTVVLSNHGTVSWADSLERAYWHTEILDAYCRILILAASLGNVERLPADKVDELIALRSNFGSAAGSQPNAIFDRFANPTFGRTKSD
jgi:L-fuculose-phosphate aldolase